MSPAGLFDTMAEQVAAQCEENLAEAQTEADRIGEEARAQFDAQRESTLRSLKAELASLAERWELKGQSEAARADLSMKADLVEQVLAEVQAEIKATVEGDGFPAILDTLLAQLMNAAEGEVVVLAPPAHVDHVKNWLSSNGHGSVSVEGSEALWDGVALQDPAHTYRISNALSSRYARVEREARKLCMTALFGSEG